MANTTKFPNLATDLRKWGLTVREVGGWQNRSANWSRSFTPMGVVAHHTASPALSGNTGSLSVVINGRKGIPGPLAQFLLARDGTVYLISGHRANHAGLGGPWHRIPKDSANTYCWGIEAENNGSGEKWSAAQLKAYYRLTAALLVISGNKDVKYAFGHKEWAPRRKPDPTGISMDAFRRNVAAAMAAGPARKPPVSRGQTRPSIPSTVLKEGSKGPTVARVQKIVGAVVDGDFGPSTTAAVKNWQAAHRIPADGIWGPMSESVYKRVLASKPKPKTATKGWLVRYLKKGNTGEDVRRVQKLIGAHSDGDFGANTDYALRKWQRAHHISDDGVAGPDFCKAAGWKWKG